MKIISLVPLCLLSFLGPSLFGATPKDEHSLTHKIDLFFGEYIVSPLAAIMFWPIPGVEMPLVVAWLLGGALFFTIRMKFVNLFFFKHALDLIRGKFDDKKQIGEVTHFQALTTALSATVGLGNIAGVAIAIGMGGPGATFWMILVGFLGMSSKFTECTLGQKYRKVRKDGRIMGGAMHYLSEIKGKEPCRSWRPPGWSVLCALHWGLLWWRQCIPSRPITGLD